MRIFISSAKARESIWAWLIWGLGFWLVLELGPFFIAGSVLKKTAGELTGPYLAFAVPWAIMAPLIWWLRKWEEQGASPKRLARGWGLSVTFFSIAVMVALFYSGVELGLMDRIDAEISFVVVVLLSAPILYFGMYHRALKFTSVRAVSKHGNA